MNSSCFLGLIALNLKDKIVVQSFFGQVLQGLEAATYCVEDMDEWLGIFNVKLRHMREDIESVETSALNFFSDDGSSFMLRSLFGFC